MSMTAKDILDNIRANKAKNQGDDVRSLDVKLRAKMRAQLVR